MRNVTRIAIALGVLAAAGCGQSKSASEPPKAAVASLPSPAESTAVPAEPAPADAPANAAPPSGAMPSLIADESGIGPIKLGMTLAQAKQAIPGAKFERATDGDGVALVDVTMGKDPIMSLFADEEDASKPIDWSKPIRSIESFSAACATREGVHPGSLALDAEKIYGRTRSVMQSEIESREYIEFEHQPAGMIFRLDYTGIFADGSRESKEFDPQGKIFSIQVTPQ
jgi:hypothetical protein